MNYTFDLSFCNPQVRDLGWLIGSAPLMDETTYGSLFPNQNWFAKAYQRAKPWLAQLQQDPTPLRVFLDQISPNCQGQYASALLQFWFTNQPQLTILACNETFSRKGETVGPLDLLFRDHSEGKVYHWQRIWGLFLARKRGNHWRTWQLPEQTKNLEDHLSSAIHEQSRLGQSKALETIGDSPKFPEMIPRILCKGYFFYPWSNYNSSAPTGPLQAAKHHPRGWWLAQPEANLLLLETALQKARWCVLDGMAGLAPLWSKEGQGLVPIEALSDLIERHFQASTRPLLLCGLRPDVDQGWLEISRGFIVPEGWGAACIEAEVEKNVTP